MNATFPQNNASIIKLTGVLTEVTNSLEIMELEYLHDNSPPKASVYAADINLFNSRYFILGANRIRHKATKSCP